MADKAVGKSLITDQIRVAAWEASQAHKVDQNLILAMVMVESSCNPFATRFEKHWVHFRDVDIWAFKRKITENTERIHQMTSWGLMQVMGAVARELGFDRDLPELTDVKLGIFYGAKKIAALSRKHRSQLDVIAAYNAGTPTIVNGKYKNQHHVNKVLAALASLQKPQ